MPINPADLAGLKRRSATRPPWVTDFLSSRQQPTNDPRWYDTAASTALRVIPGIAGTALGAIVTAPSGPGAVAGGAAGGGAGSALGEWLAQQYEQARGLRPDDTDWRAVGVEGLIGALPFDEAYAGVKAVRQGLRGRKALEAVPGILREIAPSVPSGAARGALAGSVGEGIRQATSEGDETDLGRILSAGALGTVIGGAGAGLIKGFRRLRDTSAQPPASRTAALEAATPGGTWVDAPAEAPPFQIEPPRGAYDPLRRRNQLDYTIDPVADPQRMPPPQFQPETQYSGPFADLEALFTRYEPSGAPPPPSPPRGRLLPRSAFTGLEPLPPNANRDAYFNPPTAPRTPPPDPNAPISDPARLLPPPSPVDPSLSFSGVVQPRTPRRIASPTGEIMDEPTSVGSLADLLSGESTTRLTRGQPVADVELSPESDQLRRLLAGEPLEQIVAEPVAPAGPRRLTKKQQLAERRRIAAMSEDERAQYRADREAQRIADRDARRQAAAAQRETDKQARAQARADKKLADLEAALGLSSAPSPQSTVRLPDGTILGEWDPMRWRQEGTTVNLGRPAPEAPPPITAATDVRPFNPQAPTAQPITNRQPQPGDYQLVDPATLQTDARLYQHKSGADAAGVLDKLRNVEAWDEMSGRLSPLLVHERLDGTQFVVDGHQRTGLAKRLLREGKPVPPLPAVVVREADGITPEMARRMGALHNLRTGSADPMDIAKLIREGDLSPLERRMLLQIQSDIGEKFRAGTALARLGPEAFNYVAMNDIDPAIAQAVGRGLDDPAQQVGALQVLVDQGIRSTDEADALVRQIRNAGFGMETQQTLFGTRTVANPLLGLVAKLEAATRGAIVRQRGAMGGAARNAARIAEAGAGQVDQARATELAGAAARELEMLDQYVGKATHTQEALKNAAAAVYRGELSQADAIQAVRNALDLDFQGQPVRSGAGADVGAPQSLDVNAGVGPAAGDLTPDSANRQTGPGLFDDADAAAGEVTPPRKGFTDESGQVSTEVATTLAGAGIGAVTGGVLPGTPEDRRDRALMGGFVGALAGAGVGSKMRGPRTPSVDLSTTPVNTQTKGAAGGAAPRSERFWRMTEWQPIPKNKPLPADRVQSFNLESFSPAVQHDIHNTIVEALGMAEQRRSVMPVAGQLARAQRIAVSLEKTLKPGKTLPAEGQIAYGLAVESLGQRKATLAKQIAEQEAQGIVDGNTQKEWLQAVADFDVVLRSYVGAGSEAGRSLQARKFVKSLMPNEVRVIMAAEKDNPLSAQLRAAMAATGDPVEAVKLWQQNRESGGFAKYILTNMLSGVQTQLRNFLGTASSTATRLIAKPLAAVPYDIARAKITGQPREVYMREVAADLTGLIAGIGPAVADAAHTLRYGFSAKSLQDALDTGDTLKLPGREFTGGGANPMNWVGRAMNASDRLWYTLNASAELHGQSYMLARKAADAAGIRPGSKAHTEFVSRRAIELRANPDAAMKKAMDRAAREATLTGDPGPLARLIGQAKHQHPSLNFLIAFERTVANAMRLGYEYSPASLAVKGAKRAMGNTTAFGETARDRALMAGKGVAGTMALLPLAYLASTGRLTGDGPKDPRKRAQLMEGGWRPHSILVNGHYVNYQLAQPIAFPAAVVANAFEAWADETSRQSVSTDPRSAMRFVTEIMTRMSRSVLSQSFLTGLNDILNASDEGGEAGEKAVEGILRTFIPLQGTLRNVQRMSDPVVRQPQSFGENIKASLPGLSKEVQPMMSRYGEPVVRTGGPLRRSLLVPEVEPQKNDWIDTELNRLDVQIGRPSDRVKVRDPVTGQLIRLTPEQATAIRQARGQSTRAELAMLLSLPGYANLPDQIKRTLIFEARANASRDASQAAQYATMTGKFDALESLLAPQRRIARESYTRDR